jgi:superfamily II DNA or RNA helicase
MTEATPVTDLAELLTRTNVQPRPYQQRIVTKAIDLFTRQGLRSVLIESPVGSGKTVMGLLTAKLMQQTPGLRIGWVAMRRNLLAQAREENEQKGINVELSYLSMFDKEPPTDIDMLVTDEAHHGGAASMARLYNLIRPRFILGLSATPYRLDRVDLCYDKTIKDAGIARLIQDCYLSSYHHYTVPRYTPESVVETYCREPQRWGASLVYFHTLEQCRQAATLLNSGGVRSTVVTGNSDREAQLDAFQEGKIDVLLNCLVLNEGFNFPALKTVFCRPSTKGVTIQMCGRVLRTHPAVPVKQIVQCQQTRWPFPRTALPQQQFTWTDGSWRSLTANPRINEINSRVLKALARTTAEAPAILRPPSRPRRGRTPPSTRR